MPDPLSTLEQQCSEILTRILRLGDFRSGSITAIKGRCGKPNCHCHQPGQPGHGPNFRLTRKVNGRTVSESFSSAAELRKAQREVEAFHRFRQLSQDLLEINKRICRARPVENALTPEKKNGRSDPPGNHARSRATPACGLPGPPQDGPPGSGSPRNRRAFGHASGWRRCCWRTAAFPGPHCRTAEPSLCLRPASVLPGVARQAGSHRGGNRHRVATLLPVPALPHRPKC